MEYRYPYVVWNEDGGPVTPFHTEAEAIAFAYTEARKGHNMEVQSQGQVVRFGASYPLG